MRTNGDGSILHSWDLPVLSSARNHGPANTSNTDEVRCELSRIIASAGFRDSLRLTSFITFVVETTLAGNSDRIKAYTIAVEALGRGGDFDPQTNAIVRVEAGRLRHALARYYAEEGRDDPLVIELPRGSYVPGFRRRRDFSSGAAPSPGAAGDFVSDGGRSAPPDPPHNAAKMQAVFERLAALHRQLEAMAAEIQSVEKILE